MALSFLEKVRLNHQPDPDTQASIPTQNSTPAGYHGWQITRRALERQAFDVAPVADVFGRTQPSPLEIRRVLRGEQSFPQSDTVFKRRERRRDEVIVPEADLKCSTTKRQTKRVDQKKYRNRPQQKFNGHR